MSETNLAYVARVLDLKPIPKKDMIEVAYLNGWKCIVKKGEFEVGDLAIYFSIGCVPDFDDPNFTFLRDKGLKRIKTMKMAGVVSQGLLGRMDWMETRGHSTDSLKEGDDVSVPMGVTKYIPAEEALQYDNSNREIFPEGLVPKTDATRLQHAPHMFFDELVGKEVVITRKEDGCSCTCVIYNGRFMVCGRNFVWNPELDRVSASHYFEIADKYNLEESMTALGRNVAIQGEIVGPKVNGNRMRLTERTFIVFDAFDINTQHYLMYDELYTLCGQLNLQSVPVIFRGNASEVELSVDAFLALAESTEYAKGVAAEGLVLRTNHAESNAGRTVFKVISNKYILKHDL